MNKLLLILISMSSLSIFAQTKTKTFNLHYYNNRTFYACSFAESRVASILKELGADKIKTRCHGGIDMRLPFVNVSGEFDIQAENANGQWIEKTITHRTFDPFSTFNNACEYTYRMIDQLLALIPHQVMKKSNGCWDSRGQFKFKLKLLK